MQIKNPWRTASCLLAFLLLALTSNSFASAALAKKNDCFACHAVATKLVGPAYQEVAAKYAGQTDARDLLAQSIRNGSVGKWGDVPMPPHPKLSEADAKRLATWILGGAK